MPVHTPVHINVQCFRL